MRKQEDEKSREKQKKPGNLKDEKVDVPRPGKEEKKSETKKAKVAKKKEPKKKKGCFNCRNCGCSCLVVLAILLSIPLYVLAASGAMNIPLLSPLVYSSDPQPREQVKAANVSDSMIGEKIKEAVKNNSQTISLTEEEVTGLLKEQSGVSKINVSISEEDIEFYGSLENDSYDVILTIQQVPQIKEGELDVDFNKVKVGHLGLPLIIVDPIVGGGLKEYQKKASETLKNIEKIELKNDKVLITADWQKMAEEQMKEQMKEKQPSQEEVPQKIQEL